MLRCLSLFSGIGAFEVALDEEDIEWELDHYCEIDKYACQSYNCIHGTTDEDNLKDVTNIDYSKIGDIDLVTYGFPCQDISLAGNQKGFFDEEGNLTRSGLFFNVADVIRHTNPKFAIFENVKNLTSKRFQNEFQIVLKTLDELGYNTYWKVLDSSDYGSPQSRERVFGISIRKDIDKGYTFPKPLGVKKCVRDLMDFRDVDDLTDNFYKRYVSVHGHVSEEFFTDYIENLPIRENKILTKKMNLYNFEEMDTITLIDGLSGTLTCRNVQNYNKKYLYKYRLYKPSPRMCFRMMGFKDEYFDRIKGLSDKELYNRAGNSIVVDVLRYIFRELKNQYPDYFKENEWGSDL